MVLGGILAIGRVGGSLCGQHLTGGLGWCSQPSILRLRQGLPTSLGHGVKVSRQRQAGAR